LELLERHKENDVFLVLDELGSGTGEVDGLDYGKKVLTKIRKHKVSAIFSTQIFELANFAEKDLGAISINHKIARGIGKGNLKGLMEKVGIDQYLK
jgi:DNA mismatch repair ATPase MutS